MPHAGSDGAAGHTSPPPDASREDEDDRRLSDRSRDAILGVSALAWTGYAARYAALDLWEPARVALAAGFVMGLMMLVARQIRSVSGGALTGHLAVGAAVCIQVWLAFVSGWEESIAIWFLAVVPLVTSFFMTPRATAYWGAVIVLAILVIGNSEGWLPHVRGRNLTSPGDVTTAQCVMLTLLAVFAYTVGRLRIAQVRRLREQRRVIVDQAARMERQAEALARARDEALQAVEARTRFLALMSHEIRTPLNGVIGLTALLERSQLTARQAGLVATIGSSGRQLLGIVNEVLDFARLEAGRVVLAETPLCVRACLDDLVALFQPQAALARIGLTARCEGQVPEWVKVDGTRLRQILNNLVGNAVKFTPAGEVSVTARWDGERLHFVVRDTGIGIAPEDHAGLFEPFVQGDPATSARYGGSGLGLAIARRLAEAMGGTLSMESAPGRGSTFHACVRAEAVEAPFPAASQAAAAPTLDGSLARRMPLRILVAEDDHVNQQVTLGMLRALGYAPDLVENGHDAVRAASSGSYDVVFMDGWMPGLDGRQACQRLRRLGASVRIVATTASVLPEDREAWRAAGADGFLAKPVEIPDLLAALGAHPTSDPAAAEDSRATGSPAPLASPVEASPGGGEWEVLPVVDAARLLQLRHTCGSAEEFASLAETYRDSASRLLERMRSGLGDHEAHRLGVAAHTLKSSAATFGSMRVSHLAGRLEALAGSVAWEEAATVLPQVAAALEAYWRQFDDEQAPPLNPAQDLDHLAAESRQDSSPA